MTPRRHEPPSRSSPGIDPNTACRTKRQISSSPMAPPVQNAVLPGSSAGSGALASGITGLPQLRPSLNASIQPNDATTERFSLARVAHSQTQAHQDREHPGAASNPFQPPRSIHSCARPAQSGCRQEGFWPDAVPLTRRSGTQPDAHRTEGEAARTLTSMAS